MDKKYNCEQCGFYTNLKSDYTRHIKTRKHQRNESLELFVCSICDKTFSKKYNLSRHQKKHNIDCDSKKDLISKKIEKLEYENAQYAGILQEKERCIEALMNQGTGNVINHNTLQIVNNIYTMKPLTFLNKYYSNNPSMHELIEFIGKKELTCVEKKTIQQAIEYDNKWAMSLCIDEIMKKRNRELIQERNICQLTCDQVIFTNDGSLRRFIAKGKDEWEFFTNDEPLEQSAKIILEKGTNQQIHFGKKDKIAITNHMKRNNDWNKEKHSFPQFSNASNALEDIKVNDENHILDTNGNILGLRIAKKNNNGFDYKFFNN